MKCERCSGTVTPRTLPAFDASDLVGLDGVLVLGEAIEMACEGCGFVRSVVVNDLEGLEAAAAMERIRRPRRLGGGEVRFMRTALRMKAKELADALKIRPETVSRWENDHTPMNAEMEKVFRLLVGYGLQPHAAGMSFDPMGIVRMEIDDSPAEALAFSRTLVLLHRANSVDRHTGWSPEDQKAA